jgi:predicted enzyme related to lactoylglutathione lyase
MITQIKFVSVPVHDQDRALAFFTEKLGFKVATDQPFGPAQRWIELKIRGSEAGIALFTPPGHEGRIGTFTGISFLCDDIQKTYDDLKARGVEFTQELRAESWGSSAIFKDSEGNQFVLGTK